ncbi:MAG: PHP domain-containing protein [Clostridia bacterium]|nr:PHP domain-containing protein [Clostridia bacterium]
MKYYYDFHLHSCLSPCGDEDMTPNNIVGMAKLLGLDVIALTDHNSCANCEAITAVGKEAGLCVVPGMELSTSEDIHMVCLFPDVEKAMVFSHYVREHTTSIPNRPDIYGRQCIMNREDEVLAQEENLLLMASNISIESAYETVREFGGFAYPAHIDRDSYSVTAVLGDLTPECNHGFAGISYDADVEKLKKLYTLDGVELIQSSDAHYLENMKEALNTIDLPELTPQAVVNYFARRAK